MDGKQVNDRNDHVFMKWERGKRRPRRDYGDSEPNLHIVVPHTFLWLVLLKRQISMICRHLYYA